MNNERSHWCSMLLSLQSDAARSGHRRLVVLSGDAAWGRAAALEYCRDYGGETLWMGQRLSSPPANMRLCSDPPPDQIVGAETQTVVLDAHAGFSADLFAALAGTVLGGGLLLLLTPPLDEWRHHSPCCDDGESLFLARFIACLRDHDVALLAQHQPPVTDVGPAAQPLSGAKTEVVLTADQQQAVQSILSVAHGRAHRPLVLVADRGRGKSTALGVATAALLSEGIHPVLLTAPRRAAVDQVFAHCRRLHPDTDGLHYLAPDELLDDLPPAAVLLVDEAAAIPAPMLERLVRHYPRIVFATTVHGYEGTGRGFAVRFQEFLRREYPGSRQVSLQTPVRWAEGDPLEAFVFDALLLDAEVSAVEPRAQLPQIEVWHERRRLLDQPLLLRQIFALLVTAHYQTRPRDLCYLLDDPQLTLVTAREGESIVGVCVLVNEAAVPEHLVQAVVEGRRRLQGRILAQVLLAHLGLEGAGRARFARVMRVAVQGDWRRRGVARAMLDAAAGVARDKACDFLGSSFAASEELPDFWGAQGFRLVYLGLSRDHASACHSAVMLRPLTAPAEQLLASAMTRYRRLFRSWLRQGLSQLPPDLVLSLARCLGDATGCTPGEIVLRYCGSLRNYEVEMPDVEDFVFASLASPVWHGLAARSRLLLVRRVIQGRSLPELIHEAGLTGRREATAALREAVSELVRALSAVSPGDADRDPGRPG